MKARVTPTLAAYMAQRYIFNALVLLALLLVLVYFFDTVELLRRASKRQDIPLSLVLEMSLLKLPDVGQILIPFVILFSAMFTFWQLSRQHELVVMRASGFSAWQFLAPIIAIAFGFGLVQMTIINPLGAFLLTRYAQLEQTKLSAENNPVALLREGLWLRQPLDQGYVIIHVRSFMTEEWGLKDVTMLGFDQKDQLLQRIDAPRGKLEPGQWLLED
ncbi:MAG: LptF/LptG family permease, partial [Alphaproteobacteria bacterium]|nr:LptF/LptG family permease [Alphaproteobacteria bacterium]